MQLNVHVAQHVMILCVVSVVSREWTNERIDIRSLTENNNKSTKTQQLFYSLVWDFRAWRIEWSLVWRIILNCWHKFHSLNHYPNQELKVKIWFNVCIPKIAQNFTFTNGLNFTTTTIHTSDKIAENRSWMSNGKFRALSKSLWFSHFNHDIWHPIVLLIFSPLHLDCINPHSSPSPHMARLPQGFQIINQGLNYTPQSSNPHYPTLLPSSSSPQTPTPLSSPSSSPDANPMHWAPSVRELFRA